MKSIFPIISTILITACALAQAPEKMSYQAVVRDANNALVTNQVVGMQISILQGDVTGTPVYVETQIPTTNANGLVSLEIGTGTVVSGDFTTIDWANGAYFIKTETDPTGGTTYTITGTSQLISVPYALHAKTANSITGGHYVGELFGGGIVYYVYDNGAHGLIASLDDLDSGFGALWGLNGTNILNCESALDGAANTLAINTIGAVAGEAAGLCIAHSGGGFTDWYLPGNIELKRIEAAILVINNILANDNDPATNPLDPEYTTPTFGHYWSSTEIDLNSAWSYDFYTGSFVSFSKVGTSGVRAVRAF